MPRARRRPRSVRKSRSSNVAAQERQFARAPHSFVFARPYVGSLVKQLALDVRRIFEPYTATHLQVTKKNVLKDFINIAGPLNVSHVLYLTHPRPEKLAAKRIRYAANLEKKRQNAGLDIVKRDSHEDEKQVVEHKGPAAGSVCLHLIRSPNGPSLTFRVSEYSLTRDVVSLVRKVFDTRQFSRAPLLAMTGFGSTSTDNASGGPPAPHLRLLVDMFQNILPPLNIQKLKLSSVRRVLLLSREVDSNNGEEVIYLRHFNIRTENRSISKALRRLGVGGAPLRKKKQLFSGLGPSGFGKSTGVPSLGKYASIDEYLSKASLLTDSGMSDLDDIAEVELPSAVAPAADTEGGAAKPKRSKIKEARAEAKAAHGFTHLTGCRRATIRLTEIGPRLTLKLIKIEEGVNSGSVLYHGWHKLSPTEISRQEELRQLKEAAKAARRLLQEQRRLANEAARASHRKACLEGMHQTAPVAAEDAATPKSDEPCDGELGDSEEEKDQDDTPTDSEISRATTTSKLPLAGGRISRKKKKAARKITRKHPAYNYLTKMAELKKSSKEGNKRSKR